MQTGFHEVCRYPERSSEAMGTTKVKVGAVTGRSQHAATRPPSDVKHWVERVCCPSPAVPGGKP